MTGDVNIREVIPVGDGTWRVLEPGCKRASAVTDTREEAEERARTILRNVGGRGTCPRGRLGGGGARRSRSGRDLPARAANLPVAARDVRSRVLTAFDGE